MKKFFLIFSLTAIYLLFILFAFQDKDVHAITYSTPWISSCTTGAVTVSSQSSVSVPSSRLQLRANVSFANNSSSDTVYVQMSSVSNSANAFPLAPADRVSIDTDPLFTMTTFYFIAAPASTGADLRWLQCGGPRGYE